MIRPRPTLHATWSLREESIDQSAELISRTLRELAEVRPVLAGWIDGGGSRKQALANPTLGTDVDAVRSELLSTVDRLPDGSIDTAFGWTWGGWRPRELGGADDLSLSIRAGKSRGRSAGNTLNLDLRPDLVDELGRDTMRELLLRVVDIWDADEASVVAPRWVIDCEGWEPGDPLVGWLTYLRDAEPVEGLESEPAADGQLYTATPTWAEFTHERCQEVVLALAPYLR